MSVSNASIYKRDDEIFIKILHNSPHSVDVFYNRRSLQTSGIHVFAYLFQYTALDDKLRNVLLGSCFTVVLVAQSKSVFYKIMRCLPAFKDECHWKWPFNTKLWKPKPSFIFETMKSYNSSKTLDTDKTNIRLVDFVRAKVVFKLGTNFLNIMKNSMISVGAFLCYGLDFTWPTYEIIGERASIAFQ